MFRRLTILSLLFVPVLAGCADIDMSRFGLPGPVHGEFSRTLDIEYTNLADYEDRQLGNRKIAAYFSQKAEKARNGGMPLPDDPDSIDVPDRARDDIADAYAALLHALQAGAWIDNPAIAAMAQTRFDCWLAIQVMDNVPGAGDGCRDKFEEAMALLAPGAPADASGNGPAADKPKDSFVIYFNADSIAVNDDGMENIRQAAASLRAQPDDVILLDGYTAPGEKGEASRNLSIRRSMAVRNALAQQGVGMGDVLVGQFGKAPEGSAGDAGHERRVEMRVMPKDKAEKLASKKVEALLPDNFGKTGPVF